MLMNTLRLAALLFSASVVVSCAARQGEPSQLPIEPFSGHVTVTATGTWFTPCGSADPVRWWVTYVDASVRQSNEAKKKGLLAPNQRMFVRWRASRTDDRLAGPGGPALLVRDIFEIRAPRSNDCASQTASSHSRAR
jgi:hypothetical protein